MGFLLKNFIWLRIIFVSPILPASLSSSTTAAIFHLAGAEDSINIMAVPQEPMITTQGLLVPPLPRAEIVYCKWSRGISSSTMQEIGTRYRRPTDGTSRGPQYTGRESIYPNCTLCIKQLRREDSKLYELIEGGPGIFSVGYVWASKILATGSLPGCWVGVGMVGMA
uniref:Uncharacterized protein n=1 Tax=Naja naja TaxID=35670 RepID=A0A8C6XY22_NAJNA